MTSESHQKPEVIEHGSTMRVESKGHFGLPQVILLEDEYERLFDLICASARATPGIVLLWQELQRAERVRDSEAPQDMVRLGSRVSFTELASGRRQSAQLVTPGRIAERGRISVTTLNGAALIGLRPGDTFSWSLSDGASGALHIDDVIEDSGLQLRLAEARAAARRRRVRELLSLS